MTFHEKENTIDVVLNIKLHVKINTLIVFTVRAQRLIMDYFPLEPQIVRVSNFSDSSVCWAVGSWCSLDPVSINNFRKQVTEETLKTTMGRGYDYAGNEDKESVEGDETAATATAVAEQS